MRLLASLLVCRASVAFIKRSAQISFNMGKRKILIASSESATAQTVKQTVSDTAGSPDMAARPAAESVARTKRPRTKRSNAVAEVDSAVSATPTVTQAKKPRAKQSSPAVQPVDSADLVEAAPPVKKKRASKKVIVTDETEIAGTAKQGAVSKKARVKKVKAVTQTSTVKAITTATATDAAVETRPVIARGETPRAEPLSAHEPHLRVLSWNVNGLRAMFKKEESVAAFTAMMERERPHCLLLQEIKVRLTS
jgi:hypothetical protein